jgi:hypothetical protein
LIGEHELLVFLVEQSVVDLRISEVFSHGLFSEFGLDLIAFRLALLETLVLHTVYYYPTGNKI